MKPSKQCFERILDRDRFKPLKSIFDCISMDRSALLLSARLAETYEQIVAAMGYSIQFETEVDVKQKYPRIDPERGVRAILRWHDTEAPKTFTTIVKFDRNLITTLDSVQFLSGRFADFTEQMKSSEG